jgi:hypothetical protein
MPQGRHDWGFWSRSDKPAAAIPGEEKTPGARRQTPDANRDVDAVRVRRGASRAAPRLPGRALLRATPAGSTELALAGRRSG